MGATEPIEASLFRWISKVGRFFFFGKWCSRDFWAPGVHPGSLIDLVKFALASRDSVKTICMFSEG